MIKFVKCKHCGNVVEFINDSGVPMMCCGERMEELKANTTDAAQEKHVPVATLDGNTLHVEVGSVLHPMTKEHLIQQIIVVNGRRIDKVVLDDMVPPIADFTVNPNKEIEVYAYCNLHGLWKVSVK